MVSVERLHLPANLTQALQSVALHLEEGRFVGPALQSAIEELNKLPAAIVGRVDGAIAETARLWHRRSTPNILGFLSGRMTEKEQLLRAVDLEYLFIFHRDGRMREAALQKISAGLPSPFLFAAVAWRLNDWAEPVRRAAVTCADRSFPKTAPSVIASASVGLLARRHTWARWNTERAVLDAAFARDDVLSCLADILATSQTGPLATTLRYALRTDGMDIHLERLSRTGVQSAVRSLALEVLIDRRTSWPAGVEWKWIDKPMGLRRPFTIFEERSLTVAPDRDDLLSLAVADKSALVRKVGLTGLIRHRLGTSLAREHAAKLVADKSPTIRERAHFILRHNPT